MTGISEAVASEQMALDRCSSQNLKHQPHFVLKQEKSAFFWAKVFKSQVRRMEAASHAQDFFPDRI
jgi:hypothetical protein